MGLLLYEASRIPYRRLLHREKQRGANVMGIFEERAVIRLVDGTQGAARLMAVAGRFQTLLQCPIADEVGAGRTGH